MPRIPRIVVPGVPHHVTQRGNRRQPTFFGSWDYQLYKCLLADACPRAGVEIWAYCLLPNHVHLILVPETESALARFMARTHRSYTTRINRREDWRGCLWQGRFASFPMDESHLLAATRYVLLNPLRAGLVREIADWPHSSLPVHLGGVTDGLANPAPLSNRVADWNALLALGTPPQDSVRIRRHSSTGAPLGDYAFVGELERRIGRRIRAQSAPDSRENSLRAAAAY